MMKIERIKADIVQFVMLSITDCFYIFMARSFWNSDDPHSQIVSYILILFTAFQTLVALRMVSRKRFVDFMNSDTTKITKED